MQLALVHGGEKKRNCFQFYYSNSPLTKSSPSELYNAFLLLANYVCDVAVSIADDWFCTENYGRCGRLGQLLGAIYPLFFKIQFSEGPTPQHKNNVLVASKYRVMFKVDNDDNKSSNKLVDNRQICDNKRDQILQTRGRLL
jgi:hypothetical protein